MGDDQIAISSGQAMTPESVANHGFTAAFRGYHPAEVKQFLKRVGDEMAARAAQETELRRTLQEAMHRAAHPDLDEATVTSALGEHAARLLSSAKETASSIVEEAHRQASATLRDAEQRVARMREEAESLLARRIAEADAATVGVLDAARSEANAVIEQATQQGKEMVAEAREVRERMLTDLARRRRAAQNQLEQLRAARDRLLAAYDMVRRTADEATAELTAAEPEARLAAEAVARRVDDTDVPEGAGTRRDAPSRPTAAPPAVAAANEPEPDEEPAPAPAVATRSASVFRRPADADRPPPAAEAPERPPLRPQTVADAVSKRAPEPPPSLEPSPEPAPAPTPPVPERSELGTMETPVVSPDGPPPAAATATGNGNGNGGHPAASNVEDLFARIRADQRTAADPPKPPRLSASAPVAVPAVDPVAGEQALGGRDDLVETVEAGLTRALKRILQDEQNEVLDRLRRGATAQAAALLPDVDAHRASYRDAAIPWLQQAARAGVGSASDPVPGSAAETAFPPVDGEAETLAEELVGPLRDRLTRALDEADDPEMAGESLRATYRQWKVRHVEASAGHHVLAAFNVGAFAATPDAVALQWLVGEDGHCPDCDDNALAGPTVKGQPFPTGQLHPPAHPGCRCLLVPVPG